MNPHHVAPQRLSLSPRLPPLAWVVGALLFVSLLGGPSGLATSAPGAPAVTLHSPNPGELHMEWPAATPAPSTYQVQWTRTDVVEPAGHASSVTNTLTLYELEPGVVYTVRVRAGAGPWSVPVVQRIDDYRADPETVGTIGVGAGEDGYIESAGDADWFFVDLAAGEGYPIAVTGAPAPPLAVYDATGAVVQQGLAWHHAGALTFTPPTAGLYHLAVGGPEAAPGRYTLTVDEPPTPGPRRTRTLAGATPKDAPTPRSPDAPTSVSEGATDLPNDTTTPGRVAVGGAATGTIESAGDQDRFAVALVAGRIYQFDLTGRPGGGGTLPDPFFRAIYNSAGRYQSGSYNDDFEGSRDSRVTFTPTASGTYYARVSGDRDETGSYTLTVTDVTPAPDTAPPAQPTGLTATATHDQVVLTWDDPNDDTITGYIILRRHRYDDPSGHFDELVADTGTAAPTYTDATVQANTHYTYRIKAINAYGVSQRSRWFHIATPAPPIVVSPPGDGSALWTATLSVGASEHAGQPVVGYSVWNGTGALSATTFAAGGRTVTVQVVMLLGTGAARALYLGLSDRLEGDVALWVGAEEYRLSEAELLRGMGWVYEWDAPELSWEEGKEVSVSIGASGSAPAPEGNAPGEDAPGAAEPGAAGPGDDEPGEDGLTDLSLSGLTGLSFSGARTRYEAGRGDAQSTTVSVVGGGDVTVLTVRSDEPLFFDSTDADGGQAGHQVRLAGAGQTLVLVVSRSADGAHERVYAVKVRGEAAQGRTRVRGSEAGSDASLSALTLSGAALAPAFASGTYEYAASVDSGVASVSVTATATQSGAETLISPADADTGTAGHQGALSVGANTIIVVVRSADGSALESYVVTVTRAAASADDARLAALRLAGLVLSPAFDADTPAYTASAGATVEQVTLVARPNDAAARVVIAPADADPDGAGWQIALAAADVGGEPAETTIVIVVTSGDDTVRKTYLVQVSRAAPAEPSDSGGFVKVDAGWTDACAIRVDGTMECWRGAHRSLGYLDGSDGFSAPTGTFTHLTTGRSEVCGVRTSGAIVCTEAEWSPRLESLPSGRTAVAVHYHTDWNVCRLHDDGNIECIRSIRGSMNPPASVREAGPFRQVVSGRRFGCGLNGDGFVRCWGYGERELAVPQTPFQFIAAGGRNVCGISSSDKSLQCWTWPYGYYSHSPSAEASDQYIDHIDEPDGEFIHVDTSYGPSCAVKSDGAVVCWVSGSTSAASSTFTEQLLEELNDVPEGEYLTVSVDWDSFACGLRTDQTIACWGWDNEEVLAESMPPFESPWKDSADLLGLEIGDGELSPDFDRDTTAYRVTVASNVASVAVTPQLTNTLATYTISSDQDAEVLDGEIDLSAGANTITLTVTSADATATQTYTVVVTRAADPSKSQPPSPQNVRAVAEQAGDKQGGRPKRVG